MQKKPREMTSFKSYGQIVGTDFIAIHTMDYALFFPMTIV